MQALSLPEFKFLLTRTREGGIMNFIFSQLTVFYLILMGRNLRLIDFVT
jgi:hypothetical protein